MRAGARHAFSASFYNLRGNLTLANSKPYSKNKHVGEICIWENLDSSHSSSDCIWHFWVGRTLAALSDSTNPCRQQLGAQPRVNKMRGDQLSRFSGRDSRIEENNDGGSGAAECGPEHARIGL